MHPAVGYSGGIVTSSDGISWQNRASRTDISFRCIAYGNGKYVAMGTSLPSRPAMIAHLTDGISWTYSELSNSSIFRSVTYGLNMFVAMNDSGVWTSADGAAWTKTSSPPVRPPKLPAIR